MSIAHFTLIFYDTLYYDVIFLLSVSLQQARIEDEDTQRKKTRMPQEEGAHASTSSDSKKPRIKKSAYFSDEEELSD